MLYKYIYDKGYDTRLLLLLLELLAAWSRCLKEDDRRTLREHLVTRLAAASDDGDTIIL